MVVDRLVKAAQSRAALFSLALALLLLIPAGLWADAPIMVVRPGGEARLVVYDSAGNVDGLRDEDVFIFPYSFGDVLLNGDWDGDLYDELVIVTAQNRGTVVVQELLPSDRPPAEVFYNEDPNPDDPSSVESSDLLFGDFGQIPLLADVDGDGVDEIVVATAAFLPEDATFEVFEVRNHRLVRIDSAPAGSDFVFGYSDSIAAGDVNGDGLDEIVVARPELVREAASVNLFDRAGNRIGGIPSDLFNGFFFGPGEDLRVGDLVARDGVDEIVIARRNLVAAFGSFDVYDDTGVRVGGGGNDFDFGQIDSVQIGDVDGDGLEELVVAKPAFIIGFELVPAHFNFYGPDGDLEGTSGLDSDFDFEGGWEFRVGKRAFSPYQTTQDDRDGDGLFDDWEVNGLRIGGRVLNLADLGADPDHKDLFLEIDWLPNDAPGQRVVQRMKQAYAFAPIDAGGIANPDGLPGINLWVDTGDLVSGFEDSAGLGSCTDRIDNGGDGLVDGQEPSCQGAEGNFLSGSCFDGLDNGELGDGIDGDDPDCQLAEGVGPGTLASPNTCTDSLDNDGDGLVDAQDIDCQGIEDFAIPTGCTDGLDNDEDGLIDALDPDCRVGDDFPVFTGGNRLPDVILSNLNEAFYALKGDPSASEDGAGAGTCSDGIDNGGGDENGDNVAEVDLSDPDCGNFDRQLRRLVFHYVIAAGYPYGESTGGNAVGTLNDTTQNWTEDEWAGGFVIVTIEGQPGSQARTVIANTPTQLDLLDLSEGGTGDNLTCFDGLDNDRDTLIDGLDVDCVPPPQGAKYQLFKDGGRAELGGNDMVIFNSDPGTFFHESGHNLNLSHGGGDTNNCKPNYVSSMNYDLQLGIPQVGGGMILDFSPPRFDGGRGSAPLPPLDQGNLDEAIRLDETDPANRIVFTNAAGIKDDDHPVNGDLDRDGLFDGYDWDGDGVLGGSGLVVDIDLAGSTGTPAECRGNTGTTTILSGYNDWANVRLNFRLGGEAVSGAVNLVEGPSPTEPEMRELQRELHSTDLSLSTEATPQPVEVGAPLIWTVEVTNRGPSSVSGVALGSTLSGPATLSSLPDECAEGTPGEVDCSLGELASGHTLSGDLVVDTSSVCVDGVPQSISSSSVVSFLPVYGAVDLDPSNDQSELSITPADTTGPTLTAPADLVAECAAPEGTAVDLGSAIVSDVCDTSPEVSNDAPTLFGVGDTGVQWGARDRQGNSAVPATQTVSVVDTSDPVIACNAPATVTPPDAPIAFTATATDLCDGSLTPEVTRFECYTIKKNGERIDKGESCVVRFAGDTITVEDSGGVGDHIAWEATVVDAAGNRTVQECEVLVVRP